VGLAVDWEAKVEDRVMEDGEAETDWDREVWGRDRDPASDVPEMDTYRDDQPPS
jgi:hypothetical protein